MARSTSISAGSDLVRKIAADLGRPVAALVDLPGPKIRSGEFAEGGVDLHPGSVVRLVAGSGPSTADHITVDYADALAEVEVADRVVLGDGGISLLVVAVDDAGVLAAVETGGHVQGRPGVHLPSARMKMRAPTEEDLANAETVAAAGVEYIALSFVRAAADVGALRAVVGDRAGIVAKIETATALADLDAIVAAADALMVARGDLGIDVPLEDVPHLQKHIIRTCIELGVPVITATQMLESMVDAPSPTRAEVSDVANAVFDGTDALMLSAETAIGRDPAGGGRHDGADRGPRRVRGQLPAVGRTPRSRGAATRAARASSRDEDRRRGSPRRSPTRHGRRRSTPKATAILCCTRSGRTARAMARFRPSARLIGLSPDPRTVNALALSWGVEPLQVEARRTTGEMVGWAIETAVEHGLVQHGDVVLVLAGAPDRPSGAATDILRIVRAP